MGGKVFYILAVSGKIGMGKIRVNQPDFSGKEIFFILIILTAIGLFYYFSKGNRSSLNKSVTQSNVVEDKVLKEIEGYLDGYLKYSKNNFVSFICSELQDLSLETKKKIKSNFPECEDFNMPFLRGKEREILVRYAKSKYNINLNPNTDLDDLFRAVADEVKKKAWYEVIDYIEGNYDLGDRDRKILEKLRKEPKLYIC